MKKKSLQDFLDEISMINDKEIVESFKQMMHSLRSDSDFMYVIHYAIGYNSQNGSSINIGGIDEDGRYFAIRSLNTAYFKDKDAFSLMKKIIREAFKPELQPDIALVINNNIVDPTKNSIEKLKPYSYNLEEKDMHYYDENSRYSHGYSPKKISLIVYNQDLAKIEGITLDKKIIHPPDVGWELEKKLGIEDGSEKSFELWTKNLYLSGKSIFKDDSFPKDYVRLELMPTDISVFVRKEPDKKITVASLNPDLKKINEKMIKKVLMELNKK